MKIPRSRISGRQRFFALISSPLFSLLVFIAAITPQNSYAQQNVGDESTVMYPATYFAEWAPVTAQDMLNRIPGMQRSSSSSRGGSFRNASRGGRGLGSGSSGTQILINGKRTAGKNNNSQTQLTRIDAEQVQYIEIIRGTSGELDVRGSTQIANIVLYEELSTTTLNYEASTDYYQDSKTEPGGSLTYGGQAGNLNFLLNASATPGYIHRVLNEDSILPDGSANDYIHQDRIRE